jgi:DNA mismatch endonuclease (patch repair protein)
LQYGFQYESNRFDLPGKPDIVFPKSRVVLFVDGDFWHGRNWLVRKAKLSHGHNANYWIKKIKGNIDRDRQQSRNLRAAGWMVLRIWESDISTDINGVMRRLNTALRQRGETPSNTKIENGKKIFHRSPHSGQRDCRLEK